MSEKEYPLRDKTVDLVFGQAGNPKLNISFSDGSKIEMTRDEIREERKAGRVSDVNAQSLALSMMRA